MWQNLALNIFLSLVQPSWRQRAADNRKSFWCVIHEKVLWLSWNKQQGYCLGFIAKAALTVYVGGNCSIYFEMQFIKVASSLCPLCLLFMTLIVSSKFWVQVFELPLPQQRVWRAEQGYLLLPLNTPLSLLAIRQRGSWNLMYTGCLQCGPQELGGIRVD